MIGYLVYLDGKINTIYKFRTKLEIVIVEKYEEVNFVGWFLCIDEYVLNGKKILKILTNKGRREVYAQDICEYRKPV